LKLCWSLLTGHSVIVIRNPQLKTAVPIYLHQLKAKQTHGRYYRQSPQRSQVPVPLLPIKNLPVFTSTTEMDAVN